ncbi:MAG: HD domain-containing protein [Gemmatimonadales bacterium]
MAWLAYTRVTRDLTAQAEERLNRQSRNVGVMVLDRLVGTTDLVSRLAADVGAGVALAPAALDKLGIRSLLLRSDTTDWHTVGGALRQPPDVAEKAMERVRGGRSWLLVTPGNDIFLARRLPTDTSAVLLAEMTPERVWGTPDYNPLTTEGTYLCIRNADGTPLHARPAEACEADFAEHAIGGSWTAFLGFEYGAPSWQVFVAEPADRVLAPVAGFRTSFLAVGVLTLAVVLVLASIQIRRSMEPLDALTRGTERLAAGELTHRVTVTSGDEFGQLAASFNGMAGTLEHQVGLLTSLQAINQTALLTPDAATVSQAVLRSLGTIFPDAAALVARLPANTAEPWPVDRPGQDSPELVRIDYPATTPVTRAPGPIGLDADSPLVRQLRQDDRSHHAAVGLRRGAETLGLVMVSRGFPFEAEDLERLAAIGSQGAVALANAGLVTRLDDMSWGALKALARTIDANSPWTAGHSERVTAIALRIAEELGLPADELETIHRGGLLHDIGKIGVPAVILDKAGKLEPEERKIIQRHPEIGATILGPLPVFANAIPLVRWHHEALDGSGYPDGITGDLIPENVRILTVADVFEALTADRPYRKGWTPEDTLALLKKDSGTKFDPDAVAAWEAVLRRSDGLASLVQLPASVVRAAPAGAPA